MKRILSTILFIAVAATATEARQRTLAEMKNAAEKAIASANATPQNGGRSLNALKVLKSDTQLTLLGYENGGLAVIANDDAFSPVLGYTTGTYASDNHAPGFMWWLESMNKSLEQMLADGTQPVAVARAASERKAVAPLLTTKWGQDAPFNNLCPEYTDKNVTKRYITGCVATAMAQVMNYHKYPVKGTGSYTHRFNGGNGTITVTANFGATTYDWENMLDTYTEGQYSDTQAKAVATLMLHCGIAAQMNYSSTGSGTGNNKACNALKQYFNYHSNIKFYLRDYFNIEEWMQIIYRELNDGCPIIYGGVTTSNAGHSFVLDGYDENGLVSVNWGWNGYDNGYFDIALLNGYSEMQDMVVVREPDDEHYTDIAQSLWSMRDPLTLSVSGTTLDMKENTFVNLYETDFLDGFYGRIALVAENEATNEITVLETINDEIFDYKVGNGFGISDYSGIRTNMLADGEYRVYVASISENEGDVWEPVRAKEDVRNSYMLTKTGNSIVLTENPSSAWTGIDYVDKDEKGNAPTGVYTLDGRYAGENINDMPRGIYIYNGKKVVK